MLHLSLCDAPRGMAAPITVVVTKSVQKVTPENRIAASPVFRCRVLVTGVGYGRTN
jgi:hypothetical protein